ncbi:MAG TPA: GTPase [Streptosporangiaceae bacterium]|nr:GTPase [Streptosporangiaceae bacterium]
MKEGQGTAPASLPWGEADVAAPNAGPANVPSSAKMSSAQVSAAGGSGGSSPQVSTEADETAEPHVRVDARKLEGALLEVRNTLRRLPLLLEFKEIDAVRAERQQLLNQIDDYLLPRLRQSGAPILIAMVGSTGAGKSTLLNSIVGSQVSATGIRRPTTNSPVLACHPDDVKWFAENVFLPTLPRVRQQGLVMPGRDGLLVLATSAGMPPGVALLDTPDIDSVVAAHREFAKQFLDASDLWLFVTTARRYADAVVWELLKDARDRGASLGVVLSRVPQAATDQLTAHFDAMLQANGLGDVQRFVIPETTVTDAMLPAEVSEPVRLWLGDTARLDERKVAILTRTMSGVLDTFTERIPALAAQAETQLALRRELKSAPDAAYAAGLAEFDEAIKNGSLLRGEVLARWQDFAGTGDLLRTLEIRKGRQSGRRAKRHAVGTNRAQALKSALRTSLEALICAVAGRAAEDAMERWQASPAGVGLLGQATQARAERGLDANTPSGSAGAYSSLRKWEGELKWGSFGSQIELAAALPAGGVGALAKSSDDLPARAASAVAAWQDHLLRLVQTENITKRSIARIASFDPDSLTLVLTIGVLGYGTGDVEVGEGPSAVPQQLLTSLFGAGLMRDIGGQARQDLRERVGVLYSEEALRFSALIDAVGALDENAPGDLYQASYSLESAR